MFDWFQLCVGSKGGDEGGGAGMLRPLRPNIAYVMALRQGMLATRWRCLVGEELGGDDHDGGGP
jgi:hypothetical protein